MKRCMNAPLPSSLLAVLVLLGVLIGCANVEQAGPRPRSAELSGEGRSLDVPLILRGTVSSETILLGFEDVIVHGYGLVVGLNGTGDRTQPAPVRAHMLMEMSRRGIGSEVYGFSTDPERVLSSPDTAVVIVEAVVPPGAPKGASFDVRVHALPNHETTSLEGGTLYTTELRPVVGGSMLPPTGSRQAAPLAVARGQIFTNPFSLPDSDGSESPTVVNARVGRILGGGTTSKDMPLKLKLPMPSHARTKMIEQAINTYFPQETGQREQTARGESGDSIRVNVPPSYRNRTREFALLLQHTSIQTAAVERSVQQVNQLVIENPISAEIASWRWQAFGRAALPAIKKFYDYPDERPRLAALRAGARLDDALVIHPLIDLAKNGSRAARMDAMELLGDMRANPAIDVALRELLDDEDVQVRLSAYESLSKRHSGLFIDRYVVDGKFSLDIVDSTRPLVYVTQQREPRIVIFGRDLAIVRPSTYAAWNNNFMLRGDLDNEKVDIRFHDERTGETTRFLIEPGLHAFIPFLGHRTTIERPSPGLGLNYSQTVSIIHALTQNNLVRAPFMAERDRVLARIMETRQTQRVEERPEFMEDPDFREIYEQRDVFPTFPRPGTGGGGTEGAGQVDPADPAARLLQGNR